MLEPAKMRWTRPDNVLEITTGRSRPYTLNKDHTLRNAAFVDTSNKIPEGGLISTSDDLSAFAIALESNTFLNSQTTALMWTSQNTSAGQATGYGYGWEVRTGRQPGTSDILVLLPSRDFAVAIMSNTDDIDVTPMAETLARAYLAGTGGR